MRLRALQSRALPPPCSAVGWLLAPVTHARSLCAQKQSTMVTQHPDHAEKPHWHDRAYITTHDEAEEAYRSFAELGATEYKWDWEGKLVDENVVERLYGKYFEFFSI